MGGLLIVAAAFTISVAGGCQSRSRPAIEDNIVAEGDPAEPPAQLSEAQMSQALAVMRSVAGDGPPTRLPVRGPQRGRWSDVPAAARAAAASHEMVISESRRTDHGWVFELRSVGDRPATLCVQRRPGQTVYEASATVGLFGDDTTAADELLASFDESMRALSRKRKYPEISD